MRKEDQKMSPEEIKKCLDSPVYFYNTYWKPQGERKLTKEEYQRHVRIGKYLEQGYAIAIGKRRGSTPYYNDLTIH